MDNDGCRACAYAFDSHVMRIVTDITIASSDKSITVQGKWDTGADVSGVTQKVVDALSLSSQGKKTMLGTFSETLVDTYYVDAILPNGYVIPNLKVILTPSEYRSEDVLIGMDIISHCDIAISNYGSGTIFSFRAPPPESFCLPIK